MPLVRGSTVWPDEVGRVRAVTSCRCFQLLTVSCMGQHTLQTFCPCDRNYGQTPSWNPRVESPLRKPLVLYHRTLLDANERRQVQPMPLMRAVAPRADVGGV
jgi:hypothetical protein